MADAVTFSERLMIRVQPEVNALIDQAAAGRGMKSSEWVRRAVLTELALDGFDPAAIAPRDAGSLYTITPEGQQWALIEGDTIADITRYLQAKPADDGRVWLPVEYEDSEPFDSSKHWRGTPVARIEAGRVVRSFPIVPKCWERV